MKRHRHENFLGLRMWVLQSTPDKEVFGAPFYRPTVHTPDRNPAHAERLLAADEATAEELHEWLLIAIGSHQVGDRPDRVEPRKRKRRPKHYPLLDQPRAEARAALTARR